MADVISLEAYKTRRAAFRSPPVGDDYKPAKGLRLVRHKPAKGAR